jgi:glycosyltransferase involved in cell wall biosynthesis
MKSLYITHYGILEPLGQSQILPYLYGLAKNGCSIEIISFEKRVQLENQTKVEDQRKALLSAGIRWFPRPYRGGNSFLNLLHLILQTSTEISQRCNRDSIDLIHCRSHVPFLMAWLASVRNTKSILFDFRGLLAEEYIDAGLWKPSGFRFVLTKALERIFLKQCKALVVLTEAAGDYFRLNCSLEPKKIFVIPCCADLPRYAPQCHAEPAPAMRPLRVAYSGSTAGRYDLPAMLSFFGLLLKKRPGSHFTILSTGDLSEERAMIDQSHLPFDAISILKVSHREMPCHLASQDMGILLLRGNLALKVASPTKVGEYLASGLVVVAEEALGDMHKILVENGVGCLVDSKRRDTWETALDAAIGLCDQPGFKQRSRSVAHRYFDLNMAVQKYLQAYEYAVSRRK